MAKPIKLKLANREFKAHFGLNQSAILCETLNIDLTQYFTILQGIHTGNFHLGQIRDLVYSCIAAGYQYDNEQIPVTRYEVGNLMDELNGYDELKPLFDYIINALPKGKQSSEKQIETETEVKKN